MIDIARLKKLSTIRSKVTGREYNPSNTVRITDIIQAAAYIENEVAPVDIYLSKDDNGKIKIVFLFDKKESFEAYQLWRKRELKYTIIDHETDKVGN